MHKRPHSAPEPSAPDSVVQSPGEVAGAVLAYVGPAAERAALRAYRAAVENEALAWQAVRMRLPGEPGFRRKAWDAWQQASLAARQARAIWEATASNQSDFGQLALRHKP